MIYVEILAGGNGSRMNTNIPKQFIKLNNKPIIIYSIEEFLKNKIIDKIIICCLPNYIDYLKMIIKKHLKTNKKIEIISGGNTRFISMINGCNYIVDKYGLNNNDIILIHDAARPFINQKIINNNIDGAIKYGAVGTAIPVTDTIFELNYEIITKVPLRKNLFQAQSPQSFNLKKLLELANKLSKKEIKNLTDTCAIFTLNNKIVNLVLGDPKNIKITTKYDLNVAKTFLLKQNRKEEKYANKK